MALETIDDGAILTYRSLLAWAAEKPCQELTPINYDTELDYDLARSRCLCLPCAARRRTDRPGTVVPTPGQRRVLYFWRNAIEGAGDAPTLEEAARAFGVNKVTVYGHLVELEKKGLMDRGGGLKARGWRPVT